MDSQSWHALSLNVRACFTHEPHCWQVSAHRFTAEGELVGDADRYLHLIDQEALQLLVDVGRHFLDLAEEARTRALAASKA